MLFPISNMIVVLPCQMLDLSWTTLNYILISKFLQFKHPPTTQYSKASWRNPNAYIALQNSKWESRTLTTYPTLGKKCQWVFITSTCVSCIHVFLHGWLHDGEHLHVCGHKFRLWEGHAHWLASYRVATIVEH